MSFAGNSIEYAVARKEFCVYVCCCLYQLLLRLSVAEYLGQFPPYLDIMEAVVNNLNLMFLVESDDKL